MMNRNITDIKNKEVQKEIFKLLELFEEGFLNSELELVVCHPVNPVDIADDEFYYRALHGKGRNVYCNVYFRTEDCKNALDVKMKVLEWWSRDAYKTRFASEKVDEIIHKYIRNNINEYLKTNFSEEDMELIYEKLGNGINHELCEAFVKSKFNLKLLEV